VDVELVVEAVHEAELYFAGRQVLSRRGRDEPVKLGPSVVITSGSFRSSGGSRANPVIGTPASGRPVFLEVRDVPRPLADELAASESNVRLLPPRNGASSTPTPPAAPQVESPKPEDKSRRYALAVVTSPTESGFTAVLEGEDIGPQHGVTELAAIEALFEKWITARFFERTGDAS
jgi:hypothetical protein